MLDHFWTETATWIQDSSTMQYTIETIACKDLSAEKPVICEETHMKAKTGMTITLSTLGVHQSCKPMPEHTQDPYPAPAVYAQTKNIPGLPLLPTKAELDVEPFKYTWAEVKAFIGELKYLQSMQKWISIHI